MFSLRESILSSHSGRLPYSFNVCHRWMDGIVCFFYYYYSYQFIFADTAAVCGLEIHLCSRLCSVLSQWVPKHICKWFGSLDHNLSSLAGAFVPVYSCPPALPDCSMITKKMHFNARPVNGGAAKLAPKLEVATAPALVSSCVQDAELRSRNTAPVPTEPIVLQQQSEIIVPPRRPLNKSIF